MGISTRLRGIAKRGARRALVTAGIDPSSIRRVGDEPHAPVEPAHRYANGLATELALSTARLWVQSDPTAAIVPVIGSGPGLAEWIRSVRHAIPAHFLVSPAAAAELDGVDPTFYTVCDFLDVGAARLRPIMRHVQQYWRRCDVLLINASQSLPSADDVIRLQHAAHTYDTESDLGIVAPAYRTGEDVVPGFWFDRESEEFAIPAPAVDHGQAEIPRYVFTALAHGLLITRDAVDRIIVPSSDVDAADTLDGDVHLLLARAWMQGVSTLAYTPVAVDVEVVAVPPLTELHRTWLLDRVVTGADGRRRVIFVLNATTISGGIKVVFEEAEGLADRGFDVQIWSLQGQPDWTELAIPVTTFRSYFDMVKALRGEDAIKVATWWETQQVVWLGSAVRGVPVSYIMEFESWFYPTQPLSRAAVAASYRPEFHNVTIASYQQAELAEVGVSAELIPVGFDPRHFRPLKRVARRENAVLALGRTFFQKNFAFTESAWKSLGDERPTLMLFGFEPDMLVDDRVEYSVRPSHAEANELYNAATVFVQTSLHEGFGLPVIEAMAAGCPVITTDSHGNRDFCFDGENCVVVEQGNVPELADAFRRVLGDPELRERLSAAGIATAARYRWPVIFDELAAYYGRIG